MRVTTSKRIFKFADDTWQSTLDRVFMKEISHICNNPKLNRGTRQSGDRSPSEAQGWSPGGNLRAKSLEDDDIFSKYP